jgi:hypothetical protein
MKIEITLDQSDMNVLQSGVGVAKVIHGTVVTIFYDPAIKRSEYFEKRFGVKGK